MRVVAIGEEQEYARRLVRYLEQRLSGDVHLVIYTNPKQFLEEIRSHDSCILGRDFYDRCLDLSEQESDDLPSPDRMILIDTEEREDSFYRYHSPEVLIEKIHTLWKEEEGEVTSRGRHSRRKEIISIFTPVYEACMRSVLDRVMEEGDLYLCMENLPRGFQSRGDTGELCYYIRLRQENLSETIKQMAKFEDGRYYLDAPDLYFQLSELTGEDFVWLVDNLKEEGVFSKVYIGMGSGIAGDIQAFYPFDEVVLIGSRATEGLRRFCTAFEKLGSGKERFPPLSVRYREDVLS